MFPHLDEETFVQRTSTQAYDWNQALHANFTFW